MQMRLAFDRRESVESLGASDWSRKLTTQINQWRSGTVRSPCCLILPAEGDRKRRCDPELKWRIWILLENYVLSPLFSRLQLKKVLPQVQKVVLNTWKEYVSTSLPATPLWHLGWITWVVVESQSSFRCIHQILHIPTRFSPSAEAELTFFIFF